MGKYLPYSGNHSIQEMIVAARFQKMVDEQGLEDAKDVLQTSLKQDFPCLKALHQLRKINLAQVQNETSPQHAQEPDRLGGFEFMRVRSNAKPSCILKFLDDAISINFLEYKSWETTLAQSLSYLETVLRTLNLEKNPIIGFGLKYRDRFTFNGAPSEAHAELLLRTDSKFVSKHCFNSGSLWHCDSGWFDPSTPPEKYRILNQLKIKSTVIDQTPAIIVDHNATCQLRAPRQSVESLFQPPDDIRAGIESVLEQMHIQNKSILEDMLLSEILEEIGMGINS